MGMAASQARLLELTSRQNAISRRLTSLATQKMSLTRESRAISREYNDALNSKIYKWSNGSTYQTLDYNTIMRPNSITNNKNYLITDLNGKVVLDGRYAKYAEMFSPNGQPGADWGGDTRLEILSELTGVDKDKLEEQDRLLKECYEKKDAYLEAEKSKPDPEKYGQQQTSLIELIAYSNKNSTVQIPTNSSTVTSFDSLNLQQIGNYLGSDKNKAAWKEAVDELAHQYKDIMANKGKCDDNGMINGDNGNYTINWDEMLKYLTKSYEQAGGEVVKGSDKSYSADSCQILWFTPENYAEYEYELKNWENTVNQAQKELDEINSTYDAHFDAETENLIKFYDTMFSAIADNGWVVNYNINDPEYLNNMLQNNQYMITTIERNTEYNEDSREFEYSNEYKSQLASQVNNLVAVNDNDLQTRALAIIEDKKLKVTEKEQRIDLEITDKKTEYSAIKEMIESNKTIIKDNVDRHLNLFS